MTGLTTSWTGSRSWYIPKRSKWKGLVEYSVVSICYFASDLIIRFWFRVKTMQQIKGKWQGHQSGRLANLERTACLKGVLYCIVLYCTIYRVFFIDWNIVSGSQSTIFPSKFVFRGIFSSQTSYIFISTCQTWYFFRKLSQKIAPLQMLKNRIFQYCKFLTPTSSTINLPIWAWWHVLYQKMYLLFMGKKIETLDFVYLFFWGAILAFKVNQPKKLKLKNSTKSKFPVFKPQY